MIIINESIINIILNFDFFIVEEHRNIDCCMHLFDNKNLSHFVPFKESSRRKKSSRPLFN